MMTGKVGLSARRVCVVVCVTGTVTVSQLSHELLCSEQDDGQAHLRLHDLENEMFAEEMHVQSA